MHDQNGFFNYFLHEISKLTKVKDHLSSNLKKRVYLLVNFTCLSPGSSSVCFPHLSGFKSSLNQLHLPHLDYSVLQIVFLFLFLICLICFTIFPKSDLQCRQVLTSLLFIKFLWLLRSLKCTSWWPVHWMPPPSHVFIIILSLGSNYSGPSLVSCWLQTLSLLCVSVPTISIWQTVFPRLPSAVSSFTSPKSFKWQVLPQPPA